VVDNVMGGELGADSDRSSEAQRTHHASSTSANGLARALPTQSVRNLNGVVAQMIRETASGKARIGLTSGTWA
jgi:hypothetical protein